MEIIVSHILQAKERSQSVVLFEKSHLGLGRELVLMFFFMHAIGKFHIKKSSYRSWRINIYPPRLYSLLCI